MIRGFATLLAHTILHGTVHKVNLNKSAAPVNGAFYFSVKPRDIHFASISDIAFSIVGEQYFILNFHANKTVLEAFKDGRRATNAPWRVSTEASF